MVFQFDQLRKIRFTVRPC